MSYEMYEGNRYLGYVSTVKGLADAETVVDQCSGCSSLKALFEKGLSQSPKKAAADITTLLLNQGTTMDSSVRVTLMTIRDLLMKATKQVVISG